MFHDKMCDQISDAVLDAYLSQDPDSKVACECVAKTGMILLVGEVTSKAIVDLQSVVRNTIKKIGYDDSSKGITWRDAEFDLFMQVCRISPENFGYRSKPIACFVLRFRLQDLQRTGGTGAAGRGDIRLCV
ncbi:putative S-adenosylmethionine synthase 3 [Ilyodon furcidens]|uniref:S-adenosylmethionine synthase 3 n=1 Tax=Ilyodon furcidens TaxID=33524 RepID=A0ABV0T075_9TELE